MIVRLIVALFGCWFCASEVICVAAPNTDEIDYSLQIEPILSDRCYKCHGPDEGQRQADLRLDIESEAKDYSIVPGDPESSELYLRIASHDDDRMPPTDSNLSMTDDEIRLIEQWIRQGAPWKSHWAFVPPPRSVSVPDVTEHAGWASNPIDQFVLRRMIDAGMNPSERAGKIRLIRRATFDLTGLPPTLEEIEAFLADDNENAFEKVVDRLLASPAYGERMASIWLDIARYSDTYGYQVDRDRFVWPWRDWVVRKFNDNLPYDQFLTWQVAGDLLPNATDDQILATTFNRLHPQKVEGGSTPEEFRVEYVADRTHTFATAFLGLTMECARCHDHKYDPITQREYYELFAYFNNIDEAGLYSFFTNSVPTPTLPLTDDAAKETIAKLNEAVVAAESKLQSISAGLTTTDKEIQLDSIPGQIAHVSFEEDKPGGNQIVDGPRGKALQLSGDDEFQLSVGNFKRYEPFSIATWILVPDLKERAVIFHRSRAWTDAGSRGYQLLLEDGKLSASLIHFWPGNAIRVRASEPVETNQWTHVTITYDGSSRADGLRIFVNGSETETETVRDKLTRQITGGGGDNIAIGARFRDNGFTNGQVDEMRVFDRELSASEVLVLSQSSEQKSESSGSTESSQDESYIQALAELKEKRKALCEALDANAEIMVMREMANPRQSYYLERGAYDQRRDPVSSGTPSAINDAQAIPGQNRSTLAAWACDPDHPLTSRVVVNHLWQMLFGKGIVRSPEDFGSQGMRPTHPQLLDWLARDLIEHQWDVKRTIKQIVMSSAYQQSSALSPKHLEQDPDNLWLSRFPRYRMPAEMIRDQVLAASGLLVDRMGGPPSRPYDMAASFKPTGVDKGEGLYRRSLYTYWKRTGPAPVMMALDASKRDVCRVERETTQSPMQALVILNGPQFVEAARALAANAITKYSITDADTDAGEAVASVFQRLTSRNPTDGELQILENLYRDQLAYFENGENVESYLTVGQYQAAAEIDRQVLAAMCVVANTLMNLDESVMKR